MHFLSNLITSLSNANSAKLNSISFKISTKNEFNYIFQILKILQKEGRIRGFTFNYIKAAQFKTKSAEFIIYLKYNERGLNVIKSIFLVSKTSRPVYRKTKSFWQPQITSGFFLISTKYGIRTDFRARHFNLGGYVLFGIT